MTQLMSMILNAAKKFAMMSSLLDVLLQSFDGITIAKLCELAS